MDKLAPHPYGSWQFSPSSSKCRCCVGFQCPESCIGQLAALLVDPGGIRSRQELALGDEQCHKRRTPGAFPLSEGDLGLRLVHGRRCGFYIDPGSHPQP